MQASFSLGALQFVSGIREKTPEVISNPQRGMMDSLKRKKVRTVIFLFISTALLIFSVIALRSLSGVPGIGNDSPRGQESGPYTSAVHLSDLENKSVNESSGIAASKRNADLFWTHNDSGDGPFIFAFDRQGKNRGVWRVTGAAAVDWEDMAIGPGPGRGQSYLYLGDIGDNSRNRDYVTVYRVAEPLITAKDSASTRQNPRDTEPAEAIQLRYPDGKQNAEALLIHPSTGDLYIVAKVSSGAAGIYKLNSPVSKSEISTLVRVGEFPNSLIGFVTGGAISPAGDRVILCGYFTAYELSLPGKLAFDEIWKQPGVSVNLGTRRQGESVCYRADGKALLATSEGVPCPLIEISRRTR